MCQCLYVSMFTFIFINIKHTRYHLRVSSNHGCYLLLGCEQQRPYRIICTSWSRSGCVSFSLQSKSLCVCRGVPPLAHLRRSSFNPALPGRVPSQSPRPSTNRPAEPKVQSQRPGARNETHPPHPSAAEAWEPQRADRPPAGLCSSSASALLKPTAARRHPETREGKPPRDATVKWPPRVVGSLRLALRTRLARAASSLQPRDARGAGQRTAHLRSPRPPPLHSPQVSHKGRGSSPLAPPTPPLLSQVINRTIWSLLFSLSPAWPRALWVSCLSPRRDHPSGSYWKKQALACEHALPRHCVGRPLPVRQRKAATLGRREKIELAEGCRGCRVQETSPWC